MLNKNGASVHWVAVARLPTQFGEFTAHAFVAGNAERNSSGNLASGNLTSGHPATHYLTSEHPTTEHLACVMGDVADDEPVLVRVHSECVTGDVLGSVRCDCGEQLEMSLQAIANEGRGVLLYMRDHEGRGIGLRRKLKAYELQDEGHDTVEANLHQGLPSDARDYTHAVHMLEHLGIRKIRLLTNNPAKLKGLADLVVERVPLQTTPLPENIHYLKTKRDKLGHFLGDGLEILAGSEGNSNS